MIKTAEFVSPKHPDKICDLIADSILDEYLKFDPQSRVAVEVMGGHGQITVSGEVTSGANGSVEIAKIVREIAGSSSVVNINLVPQSPSIAQGVDIGGAGDQGIMVGYACDDTPVAMPLEYELARNLCQEIYKVYPFDGKVQVSLDDKKVKTVVVSFQNSKTPELLALVRSKVAAEEYLINPAGEWSLGGFDADSGLSGRKIVIDAYGPNVPVGGGSFSGKDYTKVDRSGAYMARRIAVDLLRKENSKEVAVKLAFAIGRPEPVMAAGSIRHLDQTIESIDLRNLDYDLTPAGIRRFLQLDRIVYAPTSSWGHFGRNFPWDRENAMIN